MVDREEKEETYNQDATTVNVLISLGIGLARDDWFRTPELWRDTFSDSAMGRVSFSVGRFQNKYRSWDLPKLLAEYKDRKIDYP